MFASEIYQNRIKHQKYTISHLCLSPLNPMKPFAENETSQTQCVIDRTQEDDKYNIFVWILLLDCFVDFLFYFYVVFILRGGGSCHPHLP